MPDFVVKVDSIDVFKKRLDKYWSYQDFMFDYTAEIAVIGNRSVLTVEIDLSQKFCVYILRYGYRGWRGGL